MQDLLKIIENRHSHRSYTGKKIPKEDIKRILEVASNAPSGANMQPFNIYCVTGDKLKEIGDKIIEHISSGGEVKQDVQYYPVSWPSTYKKRRIKTGSDLYKLLEIDRKDKEARVKQWFDNFNWFNSQDVIFVTIDKEMVKEAQGMYIDAGILMQTIILAAESMGYKSCPQGATTEYGHIVKEVLEIPEQEAMLYSIVLGEPTEDKINTYIPSKICYSETAKFIS